VPYEASNIHTHPDCGECRIQAAEVLALRMMQAGVRRAIDDADTIMTAHNQPSMMRVVDAATRGDGIGV
jgi:hypothetical protein